MQTLQVILLVLIMLLHPVSKDPVLIFFAHILLFLTLSPLAPASPRSPCSPGGPYRNKHKSLSSIHKTAERPIQKKGHVVVKHINMENIAKSLIFTIGPGGPLGPTTYRETKMFLRLFS